MVIPRRISFIFFIVGIILSFALMNGCSLKDQWGEKSKPSIISQPATTQKECPSILNILTETEESSQYTLQCWTQQIDKIWTLVNGEKTESLSDTEIASLIRNRVIETQGDPEQTIQRILMIKRLLGFKGDLSRKKVDEWLNWIKSQRQEARSLYEKIVDSKSYISFEDVKQSLHIISSGLHRMDWVMKSSDFSHALITAFEIQDPDILGGLEAGSEVAINALNMVCPTFQSPEIWYAQGIASCLDLMSQKFQPARAWIEFLLNPVDEISNEQIQKIRESLNGFSVEMNEWFHSPQLTPLYPTRWIEFSRQMRANPPTNLLDSLRVIRRFKYRSTEEAIYPEAIIRGFEIIQRTQESILEGIQKFVEATRNHQCKNPEATYWTKCILPDYDLVANQVPSLKIALRVKNIRYGQKASPLNGEQFAKISLFYQLAGQVIELFHNECRPSSIPWKNCNPNFITTDLGDENDNLVQLITVGVSATETIQRFIGNIERKIKHRPFNESRPLINRRWNIGGFARLIAITSDLLVKRSAEESNILTSLLSMIILPNKSSLYLDQLSITAILTHIDSLPQYRDSYLEVLKEDHDSKKLQISRDTIIQNIEPLLRENFPRTYESCTTFGFNKSCKVTFEKLFVQGPKMSEYIDVADLDILTITATGLEGLLDSCDQDHDSRLHSMLLSGLFNSNDELDCGYLRTQEILKRLIESRIVDMTEGDAEKTKILMWLMNATPITRVNGKIAMARGTTDYLMANILLAPFYFSPDATIGSIYGLIGEIWDSKTRSLNVLHRESFQATQTEVAD